MDKARAESILVSNVEEAGTAKGLYQQISGAHGTPCRIFSRSSSGLPPPGVQRSSRGISFWRVFASFSMSSARRSVESESVYWLVLSTSVLRRCARFSN